MQQSLKCFSLTTAATVSLRSFRFMFLSYSAQSSGSAGPLNNMCSLEQYPLTQYEKLKKKWALLASFFLRHPGFVKGHKREQCVQKRNTAKIWGGMRCVFNSRYALQLHHNRLRTRIQSTSKAHATRIKRMCDARGQHTSKYILDTIV